MEFSIKHFELEILTQQNFQIIDITDMLRQKLQEFRGLDGQLLVSVQHTTTALSVNENEERLWQDIQNFYQRLAPAGDRYLHNDLHLRDVPEDEPENAHAHLISMFLNTNETIGIKDEIMVLGTYQSVLFLELDGPRTRTIYAQFIGDMAH